MRVEEGLFLNRIALGAGRVSPGSVKRAAAVVADFADSGSAFGDGTAVAARKAAQATVFELFVEMRIGFLDMLIEDRAQGGGHLEFILRRGSILRLRVLRSG